MQKIKKFNNYFKVYYTNQLRKKHKTFSDGILELITHSRPIRLSEGPNFPKGKGNLYNEDGKKISSDPALRLEFCSDTDAYVADFGSNYLIEVESQFPESEFKSGRCFISSLAPQPTRASNNQTSRSLFPKAKKNGKRKNFIDPTKFVQKRDSNLINEQRQTLCVPSESQAHVQVPCYIENRLFKHMMDHQVEGVKFMFECITGLRAGTSNLRGCILADSMGLGKTLQAVSAMYTLMKQNPFSTKKPFIKKCMIVCPVSLVDNWRAEIYKWVGKAELDPLIARNDNRTSKEVIASFVLNQYKCLIISYETFVMYAHLFDPKAFKDRKIEKKGESGQNGKTGNNGGLGGSTGATKRFECDLLICDEGHRLKNTKIKSFQKLFKFPCSRRIILTGTPIQNNLNELYACIHFVYPQVFNDFQKFKKVYADPINAAQKETATRDEQTLASERMKELKATMGRFMKRRTQKVLEKFLPKRSEFIVFFNLREHERVVYDLAVDLCHQKYFNIETNKVSEIFSTLVVLRKLLNHLTLIAGSSTEMAQELLGAASGSQDYAQALRLPLEQISSKLGFVDFMVQKMAERNSNSSEKVKEKLIIVSYFTTTIDLLSNHLKSKNHKHAILDGRKSPKERKLAIQHFDDHNSGVNVFLLGGKAGGTGLNLVQANSMILYDVDWNPSNDAQVMGRVYRKGQTRPVNIYRLVAGGTIEEKIMQRQFKKLDLSDNLLDSKGALNKFTERDLKKLLCTYQKNVGEFFRGREDVRAAVKDFEGLEQVEGMEGFFRLVLGRGSGEGVDGGSDGSIGAEEESRSGLDGSGGDGGLDGGSGGGDDRWDEGSVLRPDKRTILKIKGAKKYKKRKRVWVQPKRAKVVPQAVVKPKVTQNTFYGYNRAAGGQGGGGYGDSGDSQSDGFRGRRGLEVQQDPHGGLLFEPNTPFEPQSTHNIQPRSQIQAPEPQGSPSNQLPPGGGLQNNLGGGAPVGDDYGVLDDQESLIFSDDDKEGSDGHQRSVFVSSETLSGEKALSPSSVVGSRYAESRTGLEDVAAPSSRLKKKKRKRRF